MKIIPLPLRLPTPEEIERAKTDPDARKRVSVQRLRVKRRNEEIARLTANRQRCGRSWECDVELSHSNHLPPP